MSNMVVRTNVFALNAHRNMKNVGFEQRSASNRLSSGYRINSAADDAAGLAISETMRAQIRGLDQASRNAQDGQSMLLTTEGGVEEIGNMLQRVRELLVQSSNDTNTQDQRTMIEQEIRQLGQEISSMQQRVEFNTNHVLAMGPAIAATVSSGMSEIQEDMNRLTEAFAIVNEELRNVAVAREIISAVPSASTQFSSLSATQQTAINNALREVDFSNIDPFVIIDATHTDHSDLSSLNIDSDAASGNRNDVIAQLDARNLELQSIANEFNGMINALHIHSTDTFRMISDFANVEDSTGNNVAFFQVGANANQGISFDFETVSRAVTGAAAVVNMIGTLISNPGAGSGIGRGINVTPLISRVQSSLDDVNTVRANLGAVQNRMDYTMRSLDISSENLQDSESRVRNADIAREMMRFTMSNVLQQAAVSMLAQANQLPNNLLQLLR